MVNEKIPVLDQVKLGFKVKILKQGTDEEHVGIVDLIISEKDHPKGIFVKLKDGVKGRVQEVLESEVQEKDSEYVIEPESTRVEYKQHYVYFNPESSTIFFAKSIILTGFPISKTNKLPLKLSLLMADA